MIYSRWDPATGQFDYFESTERFGLNDDLPIPKMPPPTKLGVPSVECGRPMPRDARRVGSGVLAQGSVVPPAAVQLAASIGSLGQWMGNPWVMLAAGVAAGVAVTSYYYDSHRRRRA